jgi:hypothetical protein
MPASLPAQRIQMPEVQPDKSDKLWLRALEGRFGKVAEIRNVQVGENPTIFVFFFRDLPRPGMTTAITCGLARANHPDWKVGRPELMISMRSDRLDWGLTAGFLASAYFKQKRFSYGDVFRVDVPLAEDTEMKAYVLWAPAFLTKEQAKFNLGAKPIHLVSMYPLHEQELALLERIGLKELWHSEGFEMDNPARPPLKAALS